MKKMKITIAALMTVLSLQGFSADNNNATSGQTAIRLEKHADQSVYQLVYVSQAKGWVTVSFFDASGSLVFTERVQNETGFARPYNLRELPVGEYTIQVVDSKETITQHVFHGQSAVKKLGENQVKVNVEALASSQKIQLSVLGAREQPLEVNIFDAQSNLIYTEMVSEEGSFRKVYDLSKINLEHFVVEVSDGDQILNKTKF